MNLVVPVTSEIAAVGPGANTIRTTAVSTGEPETVGWPVVVLAGIALVVVGFAIAARSTRLGLEQD